MVWHWRSPGLNNASAGCRSGRAQPQARAALTSAASATEWPTLAPVDRGPPTLAAESNAWLPTLPWIQVSSHLTIITSIDTDYLSIRWRPSRGIDTDYLSIMPGGGRRW